MLNKLIKLYIVGFILSAFAGACAGFYLYFTYGPQKALEAALQYIPQ